MVDIHKKRIRKKRRLRHSRSTTSTATSATTTSFAQSSSSGFARFGSSASSSGSRSLISATSTRGRKYRRNVASSVATNSTYCGASGATNNNSLVLVDEISNQSAAVGSQQSPSKCINAGHVVRLTKQPSLGMGVESEGDNNNSLPNTILLKSPKLLVENKAVPISNFPSSDSLVKLNSPSLQRIIEPSSTTDGSQIIVIDKNMQKIGTDPNTKEKSNIIQKQKQVIQMNVLGLGTTLTASDDKQLIDVDEIKIDYRFGVDEGENCDHLSSVGIAQSKIVNELDKDQKMTRFGFNLDKKQRQGKSKFRRYISVDIDGEEEFYDDELAVDDDDYEHDYDDHDDYLDDDDDDDGEEVYHVGNLDEMEYLENLTSCNKVENVVMLSEFEQNLLKECEVVGGSESGISSMHGTTGTSYNKMYKNKGDKRRSMFPGQKVRKLLKNRGNKDDSTPPSSSETLVHRNKKWNQVLPGPSRAITTIEENSSS